MDAPTIIQNLGVTVETILAAFGAVAVIGGGWKYIMEWIRPNKELAEQVKSVQDKLGNDNKRLNKIEQTQNAQSILLIEIANHLITGNDKDKLKQKADDLLECITRGN